MKTMKLTARQLVLFDWVKSQHGDQKRKYTGEPYYTHLYNVAEIVNDHYLHGYYIEVALCHDVLEDTSCTLPELLVALMSSGYSNEESLFIASGVNDLTDVYTKDAYPTLNRKERKAKEAERLSYVSSHSQTVKYADLIDNTSSIIEYDLNFSKVYLQEKKEILSKMRKGNFDLLEMCEKSLSESLKMLKP